MQFFSALVHRFVPSALLVSSRRSSIKHCAAQAWCGPVGVPHICCGIRSRQPCCGEAHHSKIDRKSTRLNSSHVEISYAVFCLKKKKEPLQPRDRRKRI